MQEADEPSSPSCLRASVPSCLSFSLPTFPKPHVRRQRRMSRWISLARRGGIGYISVAPPETFARHLRAFLNHATFNPFLLAMRRRWLAAALVLACALLGAGRAGAVISISAGPGGGGVIIN